MKNIFISICASILILVFFENASSQTIPFNSENWEFSKNEYRFENHLGKESLFLNGSALVKNSVFKNGTIEFDIAVTGERGFMGALWRRVSPGNAEEFYIRPHQSGNPDANQYTPVFNGLTAWQLYYGEGYAAPVKYKLNEWMHIKIVVAGQQAEVYIIDMENPALFIPELKREIQSGKVGLTAGGGFAPAWYANFSYTNIENQKLKSAAAKPKETNKNIINSWMVSNTFDEEWLNEKFILAKEDLKDLKWTKLKSESTGITNLSRVQGIAEKQNAAFAKVVINSENDLVKKLKFGYSDNVKVYVNGKLVCGGTNFYQSRDYRYLGTIGLFDEVYLHLNKGDNEILFAVAENFGGWGILAAFDDLNGIKIKN
ncbi:MAG: hypothetical protein A2068_06970 [Ignavibacteria bacterium GWB2_35_6b]|nr:MAG: hypothetical protein A2068_06970 [Ignavibacteria bacterium GWB2_35_6b]